MCGDISNDSCEQTNEENGRNESRPTFTLVWAACKQKNKTISAFGQVSNITLGKIECPEKVIQKISSLSSSAFLGVFWTLEIARFHTRNGGSEGDESNSVDGILQVDEAAQVTSDITDNSGTGTNEDQRNEEAGVAVANS